MWNIKYFAHSVCVLLLCLFTHTAGAQNTVSLEYNGIRSNDVVYKQQLGYVEPGDAGRDMFWDFRDVDVLCESYRIEYFKDTAGVIRGIEPYSMDRYMFSADTLFQTGYETPILKIVYSRPLMKMKYPLPYGVHAVSGYEGRGLYCNRNAVDVRGNVRIEADATGRMAVSDRDTLDNVLRVHTIRTSSVGIEKDTIVRDTTDRQLEIYDIYQWFVRGWRYPVFETHEISYYHDSALMTTDRISFRYLPEMQKSLNDSINLSELDKDASGKEGSRENVISYDIEVRDGSISISYNLRTDMRILAIVSDMSGVVYRQAAFPGYTGGDNMMTIDCGGLRRGEYVLYINAGGEVHSNKVKI